MAGQERWCAFVMDTAIQQIDRTRNALGQLCVIMDLSGESDFLPPIDCFSCFPL